MRSLLPFFAGLLVLLGIVLGFSLMSEDATAPRELAQMTESTNAEVKATQTVIAHHRSADELAPEEKRTHAGLPQTLIASGTLAILEADGSLTRDVNGHFGLLIEEEATEKPSKRRFLRVTNGYRESIAIEKGHWTVRFDLDADGNYQSASSEGRFLDLPSRIAKDEYHKVSLRVRTIELDDDAGRLELDGASTTFAFGKIDIPIVLRRREHFRLYVNDAESKSPLDEVTVLAARGGAHGHPTPAKRIGVLVGAAPSPLEIDPETSSRVPSTRNNQRRRVTIPEGRYFVGAPGYAWQVVDLDFQEGESATVLLEPGGDLEVQLQGTVPEKAILRIRNSSDIYPIVDIPIGEQRTFAFDGLAVGEHLLTVELGHRNDPQVVFAQTTLHITRGNLTQITLGVTLPTEFSLARVAGRVRVDPEWDLERFSLSIMLLDPSLDGTSEFHVLPSAQLKELGTESGNYAFDFGEVQTGRYALKLSPPGHGLFFELSSEGQTQLLLELRRPVEISVRLRDMATNETATANTLVWTSVPAREPQGRFLSRAQRQSGEDEFRFTVPEGDIMILSATNRFQLKHATVRAFPGSRFVLDVSPSYTARLQLVEGRKPVPWPQGATIKARETGGPGRLVDSRVRGNELTLSVTDSGRYRITLPQIPGFEPHRPVKLKFVAGETNEIMVVLKRSL